MSDDIILEGKKNNNQGSQQKKVKEGNYVDKKDKKPGKEKGRRKSKE